MGIESFFTMLKDAALTFTAYHAFDTQLTELQCSWLDGAVE
jgi:hypothetical protein